MSTSREMNQNTSIQAGVNRRRMLTSTAIGLVAGGTGMFIRQPVAGQTSRKAAVVSSHRIATEAGAAMLDAGGTAADAAVAIAAVLSVIEPYFSSALGGGTWGLYFDAESGEITSMDGVGPVGSLATLEDYRERADQPGMHQANVPGAWDGWMLWLDRYGLLDLNDVLGPAIQLADDGFPVSGQMATYLENFEENFANYPDTVDTYIADGTLPEAGEMLQLGDLAATFQSLADAFTNAEGNRSEKIQAARDYYYRGPIAEAIVAFSEENGGYFTLDDFAMFEAEIVPPVSINYRGLDVHQNPPNSQGIAMLLALNILKGFDLSNVSPESADTIHIQVEAIKLAFADRFALVGDPAFNEIPLETLLSDEYGQSQLERIDLASAMEWPIGSDLDGRGASHTTTFHIIDQMGNAAAVTTSIGFHFLVVGNTGIHINERNKFFSVEEGNPNVFAAGKKVRHTSCPYLVTRDGRPVILGGNTGIDTQPQAQLQQFMNIADFGFTAQEAVDQPRFVSTAFPPSTYPHEFGNTLQMEEGFSEETINALEDRGHEIVVGEGIYGSAAIITIEDEGSQIDVGAESRGDDALGIVIESS